MKRLESMARRIWECLTLIGLICVLLTALGTAFLFHRAFGRQLTGTWPAPPRPSPPPTKTTA